LQGEKKKNKRPLTYDGRIEGTWEPPIEIRTPERRFQRRKKGKNGHTQSRVAEEERKRGVGANIRKKYKRPIRERRSSRQHNGFWLGKTRPPTPTRCDLYRPQAKIKTLNLT